METDILSKEKILSLINSYKDHFTQHFKSAQLYQFTYSFINFNYTGIKFTEKVYKHIYGEKFCKKCNGLLTSKQFRSFFRGYQGEFCSKKCSSHSEDRINHIKQTKKDRYGTPTYNNLPKQKRTMLEKYGVDHNWSKKSPLREKCYETKLKLYGNKNWNNTKKSINTKLIRSSYKKQKESLKNTCRKKYGVDFYVQTKDFRKKSESTFLKRYGVIHPSQVPEFHDKCTSYKWKNYLLPSGKIVRIQGYENLALDQIFEVYKEEDIILSKKDMPVIWYVKNNTQHKYFPDIFIKSENKLVEVKSEYTFNSNKEESLLKQKYSKIYGYLHEIWIYKKNKTLKEII